MKVLMVEPGPSFSVADVHQGWRTALEGLGCEVANLNYADRLSFYGSAGTMRDGEFVPQLDDTGIVRMASKGLEAACYEWWPDVVLVTSGFFVPLDTLAVMRKRGHKVVMLHTESPYEDERQLKRAEHVSLNVLNDPTNLHRFEEVGPSVYIPHAYDPAVHHPGPAHGPDDVSEFCFVGTGYPSRIDFLERVNWDGIDAAFGGNWQSLHPDSPLHKYLVHDLYVCLDNVDAADLYRATKASANLYRKEAHEADRADGWAMGPREVELAACGTFFLRDPRGEGDELFPMLPTFTEPGEFEDKLRWYLDHPDQREQAAASARLAVEDRTFENNAKRLLAVLETL